MNKTNLMSTTLTKGEGRYSLDGVKKMGFINGSTSRNMNQSYSLDELNEVIKILRKRQENYLQLIEVFKKKRETATQFFQINNIEQVQMYNSIKFSEAQRIKDEAVLMNHFQGVKIGEQRMKMFVQRFCMRVCEVHEQGIMKLKSLMFFDQEIERQNNNFLQKLHSHLQLEILDLESILNLLMKHFARSIDEELKKIRTQLGNSFLMIEQDDFDEKAPLCESTVVEGIVPSIVFEPEGVNVKQQYEVFNSINNNNKENGPSAVGKKNETLAEIMKQQQNFFSFYSKKFFSLYDVLSLDKAFVKNQVSQLRLGNIDKHLFELIAKNSIISESLKSYICTATAARVRSANTSPSLSPKRAQKNRQNYITRLLTTSFFGPEVPCLSARNKSKEQNSMKFLSQMQQNSSFYQSSPEKDSPPKNSPPKNQLSQIASQISRWNSQNSSSPIQQTSYLPIRLFSAGCPQEQLHESSVIQDEHNQQKQPIVKPFVYLNTQFSAFRGVSHQATITNWQEQIDNTILKQNYRQNSFESTRKVFVKDIDCNISNRGSFILKNSNNTKQMNPTFPNDRPKGTVRFIKKQSIQHPQTIEQPKQNEEERSPTPNSNLIKKVSSLKNRNIKGLKEEVLAISKIQQSSVYPSTPIRKISPGKTKKSVKKSVDKKNNCSFSNSKKSDDTIQSQFHQKAENQINQCELSSSDSENQLKPKNISSHINQEEENKNFSSQRQGEYNNSSFKIDKKRENCFHNSYSLQLSSKKRLSKNEMSEQSESNLGFSLLLDKEEKIKNGSDDCAIFSDNFLVEDRFSQNKQFYQAPFIQQVQDKDHFPSTSLEESQIMQYDSYKLNQSQNDKSTAQNKNSLNNFNIEFNIEQGNSRNGDKFKNISASSNIHFLAAKQPSNQIEMENKAQSINQSFDYSLNVNNNPSIQAPFNRNFSNTRQPSRQRASKSTYEAEVDQLKNEKQVLRNALYFSNLQKKRDCSNSSNENEQQSKLNQQSNQNDEKSTSWSPFPLRQNVNAKIIIQRTTFNSASQSRNQQILVAKNDYSNNQAEQTPNFVLQQTTGDFGITSARGNNFLFHATGRKIDVNFPKIVRQLNKTSYRPSSGSTPVKNESYSKF